MRVDAVGHELRLPVGRNEGDGSVALKAREPDALVELDVLHHHRLAFVTWTQHEDRYECEHECGYRSAWTWLKKKKRPWTHVQWGQKALGRWGRAAAQASQTAWSSVWCCPRCRCSSRCRWHSPAATEHTLSTQDRAARLRGIRMSVEPFFHPLRNLKKNANAT